MIIMIIIIILLGCVGMFLSGAKIIYFFPVSLIFLLVLLQTSHGSFGSPWLFLVPQPILVLSSPSWLLLAPVLLPHHHHGGIVNQFEQLKKLVFFLPGIKKYLHNMMRRLLWLTLSILGAAAYCSSF